MQHLIVSLQWGIAGQYQRTANHLYCKFWWAATLTEAGYIVLFMDNDVAVVKNPYDHFAPQHYDLEGLSDWIGLKETPTAKVSFVFAQFQVCIWS